VHDRRKSHWNRHDAGLRNRTRTDERATGELAAAVERRGDHAGDGSWRIRGAADRHNRDARADAAETGGT